jgi:hypothetical protein
VYSAFEEVHSLKSSVQIERAVVLVLGLVAFWVALSGTFVDDEGWLTFVGAKVIWEEPVAALFLQKIHPTLSVLYAPFAAIGWKTFLAVHVLFGVGAVFLAGATARRWTGNGWIAAIVMAGSPIFFVSVVSGQSNSTGIFFLALTLFLYRPEPKWSLASGLVAGLTIWTRYEQIPYLLGLLFHAVLRRRDWRFALGFFCIPGLFVIAGAIYHGSLLWLLEYPPNNVASTPGSAEFLVGKMEISPKLFTDGFYALCLVCPLWVLPILPRLRSAPAMVRLMAGLYGLLFFLMFVLPVVGHWFNFEPTTRYLLNLLLPLAIVSSWVLSTRPTADRNRIIGLLVCFAALLFYLWREEGVWLVLAPIPVAILALSMPRRLGVAIVVVALLSTPAWTLLTRIDDQGLETSRRYRPIVEILEAAPDATVYTDVPGIGMFMEINGYGDRVHMLVPYDIPVELNQLLNQTNGQSQKIWSALQPYIYGGALWACQFPHRVEKGALLILRPGNERMRIVYDIETWLASTELAGKIGPLKVHRNRRDDLVVPYKRPPDWLDQAATCSPCPGGCPKSSAVDDNN